MRYMKRCLALILALALLAPAALAEGEPGFWEGLGQALDDFGSDLGQLIGDAWESSGIDLNELAEQAGEWLSSSAELAREYVQAFDSWMDERFGADWTDLKESAAVLWTRFLEGLSRLLARVVGLFADEDGVADLLTQAEPLADLYTEAYAAAYADAFERAASSAWTPDTDTQAVLTSLRAYTAARDDAWEARMEAVKLQVDLLQAWLKVRKLDADAVDAQAAEAAEAAVLSRLYPAAAAEIRSRIVAGLPGGDALESCLRAMEGAADAAVPDEEAQKQIDAAVRAWLADNGVDEEAFLDAVLARIFAEK